MVCKNIKRILAATFVISFLCGMTSCAKTDGSSSVELEEKEDAMQIGLSIDSLVIERWTKERDLFVAKAQELGAEVNVQNANGVVEEQIKQIEYFIEKKMDVIVVIAIDDLALHDVITKAKKAGIKIIAYDRLVRNANVDLYLSIDNEKVGELMAKAIVDKIGRDGNIIQIKGSPTDYNVQMVQEGFDKVIGTTNIVIDEVAYSDNWLAENGFVVTDKYLSKGKIPDAIMCGNDNLAANAIKSLLEHRLAGKVCVVGQDADLEACQRIVEGTQYMTVYKPIEKLAKEAAVMAVDMVNDVPLELKETMNDGSFEVPYKRLDPIAVTKNNMDEVITGKYHQRSEIYLNVE